MWTVSCGQHSVEQDIRTGDSKDPRSSLIPRSRSREIVLQDACGFPLSPPCFACPRGAPRGGVSASIALGLQRDPRIRGMRAPKDAFGGTPPAGRATRGLQESV